MTLQELLTKETVKEIRIAYCHCFDGQDLDGLVGLFADDAVCEFGPQFGGDWVGKEEIRARFAPYMTGATPLHGVMHAVTNPLIKLIDEETAHGRWYLHDLRTTEGEDETRILYGIYDDVYKLIDGEWLIHRSRIDFLWPNRNVGEPRTF